jgi:hypothetical protein
VELARQGEQPVAQIAKYLGISQSCLRRWMAVDNVVDAGRAEGVTSSERRSWPTVWLTRQRLDDNAGDQESLERQVRELLRNQRSSSRARSRTSRL